MVYENFGIANTVMLWGSFAIAFIMGAVVNKTNFCTMGAVSDYVNIGDTGRWRSWLFAIAVAIVGVILLEKFNLISFENNAPKPNYRTANFAWFEYLLGGLLFGIGMTFASGCGNKTLIRIGGGNIKSIFVLLVMGFFAYAMIIGFGGISLYGIAFLPWTSKIAVSLPVNQDLGSLTAHYGNAGTPTDMRLWIGVGFAVIILLYVIKSRDFFGKFDNILGGLVVGLAVVGMWYLTGSANINAYHNFDNKKVKVSWADYVKQDNWNDNFQPDADRKKESDPKFVRPDSPNIVVGPQGLTFVSPSAWVWNAGLGPVLKKEQKPAFSSFINVPVMLAFGIIAGSFFWSLVTRTLRFEWFASGSDVLHHFVGATLMGIGGVLALGCTIGQGVTGISTLALGSFIAFLGIIIGCALTMKVRLYRMVYEDASFISVLTSALADLRLLPRSLKKLESI